jgi:hypothetical protein
MSTRYHPIDYEWGRVLKLAGVALAMYALIVSLPISNPYVSFVVRFAIAAAYPFALALVGFYAARERARLAEIWAEGRARAGRLVRRTRPESIG